MDWEIVFGLVGTVIGVISLAGEIIRRRRATSPNLRLRVQMFGDFCEAFLEIHNRLDEDIRLLSVETSSQFYTYDSSAPGGRRILGKRSDMNDLIEAGGTYQQRFGIVGPQVDCLVVRLSSSAGSLRNRKFVVHPSD